MCGIINPVPTELTIVCVITHTAVLVIQDGETALDMVRSGKGKFRIIGGDEHDKVVEYLESVGK